MREIKFRAWVGKNEMIYSGNTYGDYILFFEKCREHHDGFGGCLLMQYTGRKDKNGKDIYEGDCVRKTMFDVTINFPDRKEDITYEGIVEFFQAWNSFVLDVRSKSWEGKRAQQGFPTPLYFDGKYELEILGNIYEHNHLLDKQ